MGKKYIIDETTLTDIANGLRETLNDLDAKHKPEDMRQKINDVYNMGEEDGFNYGYVTGLDEGWEQGSLSGYNVGYLKGEENGIELGKQTENKAFWDNYLSIMGSGYINNVNYLFAGDGWNDDTFYPDRNLIFIGYNSGIFQSNKCTNLRKRFEDLGITIGGMNANSVLSQVASFFRGAITPELPDLVYFEPTNLQYFCEGCKNLTWIPYYNTSKCTNMNYMVQNCPSLERIEGIDFSSVTYISNAFTGCTSLTTIVVYGVIPISISFSASPLSVESMISIITHLKDYAGTTNAGKYTLTLKDTCKTLMAEQGEIEELGGKTYDQYITDIGWNLA